MDAEYQCAHRNEGVTMAQDGKTGSHALSTAADVVRESGPAVNTYRQRAAYLSHPAVRKALAWERKQREFEERKASKTKCKTQNEM
jgi:hypothetical protein